jgi:hypothetical protein
MSRLKKGELLSGAQFAESVEPLPNSNARILAHLEDGTAAITSSTYGKGQTFFIGSFLGLAIQPGSSPNRELLMGVVDWAKGQRPFTTSLDGTDAETPLEARMQTHADGRVLFLVNHAKVRKSVTVRVHSPGGGQFALREIRSGQTLRQQASGEALTLTRDIPAKQVEIWDITRGGGTE